MHMSVSAFTTSCNCYCKKHASLRFVAKTLVAAFKRFPLSYPTVKYYPATQRICRPWNKFASRLSIRLHAVRDHHLVFVSFVLVFGEDYIEK